MRALHLSASHSAKQRDALSPTHSTPAKKDTIGRRESKRAQASGKEATLQLETILSFPPPPPLLLLLYARSLTFVVSRT